MAKPKNQPEECKKEGIVAGKEICAGRAINGNPLCRNCRHNKDNNRTKRSKKAGQRREGR